MNVLIVSMEALVLINVFGVLIGVFVCVQRYTGALAQVGLACVQHSPEALLSVNVSPVYASIHSCEALVLVVALFLHNIKRER